MLDRLVEFPYSVPSVPEIFGIKQYSIGSLEDGLNIQFKYIFKTKICTSFSVHQILHRAGLFLPNTRTCTMVT